MDDLTLKELKRRAVFQSLRLLVLLACMGFLFFQFRACTGELERTGRVDHGWLKISQTKNPPTKSTEVDAPDWGDASIASAPKASTGGKNADGHTEVHFTFNGIKVIDFNNQESFSEKTPGD